MTQLRLLSVAHNVGLGGAARSLRELIRNYDGADFDLAVPRFASVPDDAAIRSFFGDRLRRICRFWLPWSEVYAGHPTVRQSARSHLLFPLAWRAQQASFERFVRREHYDLVHLNSLVLHPMLRADLPMLLHVREILTEQHDRVRADAARAAGVIFIDEATRKPFTARLPEGHVVLNNPVDMTAVGTLPASLDERLHGRRDHLTVFAMIGDLNAEKGTPFVIDAFREVRSPDVRLVLVGRSADRAAFEQLAAGDSRIILWGEEREIAQVYSAADHVIRGEAYPCVGRTIYEALYAGCGVIVPGAADTNELFERERFADRVRFYAPRDRAAFVAAIEAAAPHRYPTKQGASNVTAYVAEFDRFVRRVLGKA
ncbi:MAG: glycosyltransferase [Deltaproteobacteria bacterium]